jgi:SAM-dependent methyltransferase
MAKLSKAETKLHNQASALLAKDHLSFEDAEFVLTHWQEGANHVNGEAGAFFTPLPLAWDFAIEVQGSRILDLCAGIGALAFCAYHHGSFGRDSAREIVCVEKNPAYIEIGRKILPQATWIQADVFNLPDLGEFDCVISNAPFGNVRREGKAPRYSGAEFELGVIDIASDLGRYGVFIVPQMSAPFTYSGRRDFQARETAKTSAFRKQTRIEMQPGCGIDCSFHVEGWHGVAPVVEIVAADFEDARAERRPLPAFGPSIEPSAAVFRDQADLFSEAA